MSVFSGQYKNPIKTIAIAPLPGCQLVLNTPGYTIESSYYLTCFMGHMTHCNIAATSITRQWPENW